MEQFLENLAKNLENLRDKFISKDELDKMHHLQRVHDARTPAEVDRLWESWYYDRMIKAQAEIDAEKDPARKKKMEYLLKRNIYNFKDI